MSRRKLTRTLTLKPDEEGRSQLQCMPKGTSAEKEVNVNG